MKLTRQERALEKAADELQAAIREDKADKLPRLRKVLADKLESVELERADYEERRRLYWQFRAAKCLEILREVAGPLVDEIAACRHNSINLVPHANPVQIVREALLSSPRTRKEIAGDMPTDPKSTELMDRAEALLHNGLTG